MYSEKNSTMENNKKNVRIIDYLLLFSIITGVLCLVCFAVFKINTWGYLLGSVAILSFLISIIYAHKISPEKQQKK